MTVIASQSWADFTRGVAAAVSEGKAVKIVTGPEVAGGWAANVDDGEGDDAIEILGGEHAGSYTRGAAADDDDDDEES